MINFYHRFFPLQELLKGQRKNSQAPVDWTPNRRIAFKKFKDELVNATFLTFSDPSAQLVVQIDASGSAIGAVL